MEIKQDHHCMKIPDQRRSGAGRLQSLAGTLVLIWAVLYVTPAHAYSYTHVKYSDVSCRAMLKLSHASGVPGGAVHSYVIGGFCSLRSIYTKDYKVLEDRPPLVATARWDESSHTYNERFHLLQAIVITQALDTKVHTHNLRKVQVSTDPEDATFKCDVDPVINAGAHCSLVSQYNATGWGGQTTGFAWNAVHNRPLILGIATVSQARALSKRDVPISCSGLKLTAATGVPNGKNHTYKFSGLCELYHTQDGSGGLQVTRVLANGKWNAAAQEAAEGVTVLTMPNQGGGGWSTKYICTNDPWLHPHATCSRTSRLGKTPWVYDPITDILDQHPITLGRVDADQAAQLSNKAAQLAAKHKNSSTQSGNKSGPSLENHGAAAGTAQSSMKNLHLSSPNVPSPQSRIAPNAMQLHAAVSAARSATMQARPALKMPSPNLKVLGEKNIVDQNCRDPHRLIVVDATVRNDGGPLAARQWALHIQEGNVKDASRAVLAGRAVWVPPLDPHAVARVLVPVSVMKGRIAQLPGKHWLNLISQGAGHKSTTLLQPFTFASGTCQPKLHVSRPAQMRIQHAR